MQTVSFIPPPKTLQAIVGNILVLENKSIEDIMQPLPFYADGCPGLIFQQTANSCLLYNRIKRISPFFLYGQTVNPIELLPSGSYRIIVFIFYPHVLKSLFNIRASELTDNCIDLEFLPIPKVHRIIDELQNTENVGDQVRTISNFLSRLLQINEANVESSVIHAISHLLNNSSDASLQDLRKELNITERTFERKFEHYVGVSPKLFLRICRFHASLQQIRQENFIKLSDVAYENGYADQSHFIRTFKEFTGISPLEYCKAKRATKDSVHAF